MGSKGVRSEGATGGATGVANVLLSSDGGGLGVRENRNLRAIQALSRAGRPLAVEPAKVERSPASVPGCAEVGWVTSSLHMGHCGVGTGVRLNSGQLGLCGVLVWLTSFFR